MAAAAAGKNPRRRRTGRAAEVIIAAAARSLGGYTGKVDSHMQLLWPTLLCFCQLPATSRGVHCWFVLFGGSLPLIAIEYAFVYVPFLLP